MKIRKGFVSNSSSSSFIVKFPKKPESKEELVSFLDERTLNLYDEYNIADTIWINHIVSHIEYSSEQYITAIAQNLLGIQYNYDIVGRFIDPYEYYENILHWMAHNEIPAIVLLDNTVRKIIEDVYFKQADDSFKMILSFSDDSELGSVWEHRIAPNVFGNYLQKCIGNH